MSGAATAAHRRSGSRVRRSARRDRRPPRTQFIEGFEVRRFDREWREILLHAFSADPWSTNYAWRNGTTADKRQVRVAYRYVGPQPAGAFLAAGSPSNPCTAKSARTSTSTTH